MVKLKVFLIPAAILDCVGSIAYIVNETSQTSERFYKLADLNNNGKLSNEERAKVYELLKRDIPVDTDIVREYLDAQISGQSQR